MGKRRNRRTGAAQFVPELRGPIDETDPLSDQCQAITSTGTRCTRSTVILLGGHSLCAQHAAMDRVRLVQRRAPSKASNAPGSKPRTRRVAETQKASPTASAEMIGCPSCSAAFVSESRLLSHTLTRHRGKRRPRPRPMRKLVPCPTCAVPVRRDRLQRHNSLVHPTTNAVQYAD